MEGLETSGEGEALHYREKKSTTNTRNPLVGEHMSVCCWLLGVDRSGLQRRDWIGKV